MTRTATPSATAAAMAQPDRRPRRSGAGGAGAQPTQLANAPARTAARRWPAHWRRSAGWPRSWSTVRPATSSTGTCASSSPSRGTSRPSPSPIVELTEDEERLVLAIPRPARRDGHRRERAARRAASQARTRRRRAPRAPRGSRPRVRGARSARAGLGDPDDAPPVPDEPYVQSGRPVCPRRTPPAVRGCHRAPPTSAGSSATTRRT